jgi:Raf kinase inhibitor-like YbhB/YbcL family protein
MSNITVTSPAFSPGTTIPQFHTCDGQDFSPELAWHGVPAGTRSLALICDDPDAPGGDWVHWVVFNIPPVVERLAGGIDGRAEITPGGRQGRNDFGRLGYGGPCPPPGKPHRYFFRIYALDTALDLPPGTTRDELRAAMKGHVLAEGGLMGTYGRG